MSQFSNYILTYVRPDYFNFASLINYPMLSEKERQFIEYWEKNRDRESQWRRQIAFGIPIGLLFAVPVILILFTAKYWYKRADAVANAKLDPLVLLIAVFFIVLFVAVFYKKYQWEMREQLYQELKNKMKDDFNVHSKE